MNKLHKIIIVIVFCIGCFSAYSLAEINISQQINYKWYNQDEFCSDIRYFYQRWNDKQYPKKIYFNVLTKDEDIILEGKNSDINIDVPKIDFKNEFLIFASLGEVNKNGYDIRVKDISQRGNIVEVMLNLSSLPNKNFPYEIEYPHEFVKLKKDDLDIKGKLLFVFKDVNGLELYRKTETVTKE